MVRNTLLGVVISTGDELNHHFSNVNLHNLDKKSDEMEEKRTVTLLKRGSMA